MGLLEKLNSLIENTRFHCTHALLGGVSVAYGSIPSLNEDFHDSNPTFPDDACKPGISGMSISSEFLDLTAKSELG